MAARTPDEKRTDAIVDATLWKDHPGDKPKESGNKALDAALRDPEAKETIATAVIGATGLGFIGGVAVGGVAGAGIIGLAWALWPKKKSR